MNRWCIIIFYYIILLILVVNVICVKFQLNDKKRIIDNHNRIRFFHGVNVVYKSPPYLPVTEYFNANLSFSIEDMKILHDLGVNVIRLGTIWSGAEPINSQFNETYLDKIEWIVNNAANYSIYTLFDAHQDTLSEKFCGEGIPQWSTELVKTFSFKFPIPIGEAFNETKSGLPTYADCTKFDWPLYEFADATCEAYQSLYTGAIKPYFVRFWAQMTKRFKNVDNIIGFELLNEPFAGWIYKNIELMIPGTADRDNLQPFYDTISAKIHSIDNERLIFYESITWDDIFNLKQFQCGFEYAPANLSTNTVYTWHYYSKPNIGSKIKYFQERMNEAKRLKGSNFVSEFSLSSGPDTIDTMNIMDELLINGYTAWEYKKFAGATINGTCTGCGYGLFNNDGSMNMEVAKALSRTYAYAIAGDVHSMKFDPSTKLFQLNFTTNNNIDINNNYNYNATTEIYLNQKLHYSNGVHIDVLPSASLVYKYIDANHLQFSNQKSFCNVSIIIKPSN